MGQRRLRSLQLAEADYEFMAARFRLLGNKNTLKLLENMGMDEWKVTELATRAGIKQPLASRRLKLLERGGVVTSRDQGRNVFYKIDDPTALDLCNLMRKRAASRRSQSPRPSPPRP